MKQFGQLLLIHFREFFREPAVLFWSLIFPAALAITLGFAFRTPSDLQMEVGLIDKMTDTGEAVDGKAAELSPYAERIKRSIEDPGIFHVHLYNEETAMQALKRGMVRLLVVVDRSGLIFKYDPASETAVKEAALLRAALYAEALKKQASAQGFRDGTPGVAVDAYPISEQKLSIPGTRYIDYLIPGLMAFGVMNACLWGIGWSLISMRMKKLLRRMAAAPMDQNLFFLSFAVARILLVIFEAAFLMLVAFLFFDLLPAGSYSVLLILLLSGVFCFAGMAVLLACRTANTQVGNGLINAAVMPMMLLSGVFFSYHGFPDFLQPFIELLPLTVLADSVRAVYLEARPLDELWKPVLLLTVSGMFMFAAGRRYFRWG
jgi:ABC-type multidrug transport system permease subunit